MIKEVIATMLVGLTIISEVPFTEETIARPITQKLIKVTESNIKMVGDNLIHGSLNNQCKQADGSYKETIMYEHVKEEIQSADIAIINQETMFVEDESDYSGYPRFGTTMAIGDSLVEAGFDVIAHATNHTLDQGLSGIEQTLNFWSKYPEINVLGIHDSEEDSDICYIINNNIVFSFVNYTYGLNGLDSLKKGKDYVVDMLSDENIDNTMKEASENSDFQIAILHVGDEYVYTPTSYARKHVDKFIDLGADLVLCAHPHVLETYGKRTTDAGNTAVVYYSLGNFISTQNKDPRMIGGMADITIRKVSIGDHSTTFISNYELIPTITHLEKGNYCVYYLKDYTNDLCKKHNLFKEKTVDDLWKMYLSYISEADYLITR